MIVGRIVAAIAQHMSTRAGARATFHVARAGQIMSMRAIGIRDLTPVHDLERALTSRREQREWDKVRDRARGWRW